MKIGKIGGIVAIGIFLIATSGIEIGIASANEAGSFAHAQSGPGGTAWAGATSIVTDRYIYTNTDTYTHGNADALAKAWGKNNERYPWACACDPVVAVQN